MMIRQRSKRLPGAIAGWRRTRQGEIEFLCAYWLILRVGVIELPMLAQ